MSGIFPTHWKMENKLQKTEDWGTYETRHNRALQEPSHGDAKSHKWDDPGPHQPTEEGCLHFVTFQSL